MVLRLIEISSTFQWINFISFVHLQLSSSLFWFLSSRFFLSINIFTWEIERIFPEELYFGRLFEALWKMHWKNESLTTENPLIANAGVFYWYGIQIGKMPNLFRKILIPRHYVLYFDVNGSRFIWLESACMVLSLVNYKVQPPVTKREIATLNASTIFSIAYCLLCVNNDDYKSVILKEKFAVA